MDKFREQIKSLKQDKARWYLISFILGIVNGFLFTLMFEPLLKFVLYGFITNAVWVTGCVAFFFLSIYLTSRLHTYISGFSFERALKSFFLGVSAISFFFALYNFIRFPDLIFAGDRSWIAYGKDYAFMLGGNYAVRLSDIHLFYCKNSMVYLRRFPVCSVRSLLETDMTRFWLFQRTLPKLDVRILVCLFTNFTLLRGW